MDWTNSSQFSGDGDSMKDPTARFCWCPRRLMEGEDDRGRRKLFTFGVAAVPTRSPLLAWLEVESWCWMYPLVVFFVVCPCATSLVSDSIAE